MLILKISLNEGWLSISVSGSNILERELAITFLICATWNWSDVSLAIILIYLTVKGELIAKKRLDYLSAVGTLYVSNIGRISSLQRSWRDIQIHMHKRFFFLQGLKYMKHMQLVIDNKQYLGAELLPRQTNWCLSEGRKACRYLDAKYEWLCNGIA